MPESRGAAYVLQKTEERNIGLIELWTLDTRGRLCAFTILRAELDATLELGLTIPGDDGTSPCLIVPDPLTFVTLPRTGHEPAIGRLFGDLQTLGGGPVAACPRTVLKRQLGRAKALGYHVYVSAVLDARFIAPRDSQATVDQPLAPIRARALAREVAARSEALGLGLGWFAPRPDADAWQFELDAVDPLSLADGLVTLRRLARDTAAAFDADATFMPRPWVGAARAGLAITMALGEGADPTLRVVAMDAAGHSDADRAFAARVARALADIEIIARPSVNGRHTPGSTSVETAPNADGGRAVTLRGVDANANPYYLLAVAIGAALDATIESDEVANTVRLPALVLAPRSALLRDVLGADLVAALVARAAADEAAWQAQVTTFERDQDRDA